jgi:hypothetical protein
MLSATVVNQDSLRRARVLVTEILPLAPARDHKTLLAIADVPEIESLLGLLPRRESRQAEIHIEGARISRAKQNRKAREKIDAADEALSKLDLVLAREFSAK